MKRALRIIARSLALTALLIVPVTAWGSGGNESAPAVPETPALSPEQIAVNAYNEGLKLREKAVELDRTIAEQSDEKKRTKLEKKRGSLFNKASQRFETAIENKPDFAQAHGSLGYALRRLGEFERAMEAYDTALSLNPNYPNAIEYRAEALLGLGRIPEAQEAYQKLSMISAEHASELLAAVKVWASDEGHAAAAAEYGVAEWIAAHEQVSEATGAGSGGGPSSW